MDIKHPKIFDTDKIEELYSKKDGVPVKYVVTTDLKNSDQPLDIFYRETPHPEFGNKYFGLYKSKDSLMITDADSVEDFEFGMIQDKDNNWYYSSCHHDCLFIDGKMIDGGRVYIRSTGLDGVFKIKNGEFINVEN
jgi:hypothetical protein